MAKYKVFENPSNGHREKVKDGFNWVVLFFGPIWYLFNGMAAQGLGWLLVAVIAGSFTMGLGAVVVWIVAGVKANAGLAGKYLRDGWKHVGWEDGGAFIPVQQAQQQDGKSA